MQFSTFLLWKVELLLLKEHLPFFLWKTYFFTHSFLNMQKPCAARTFPGFPQFFPIIKTKKI